MGPFIISKWEKENLELDLNQILKFTLIEECHTEIINVHEIKFKMQILKNQNVLILSTTFYSHPYPSEGINTQESPIILIRRKKKKQKMLYSLSLVWSIGPYDDVHSTHIKRILDFSNLLKNQIHQLSGVFRDIIKYQPEIINNKNHSIQSHINEFLRKVETICNNPGISIQNIGLEQTVLEKANISFVKEFLIRAITCHLQMHGRTVVLGNNCEEINKWINTLALFVQSHEAKLCKYATSVVSIENITSYFIPEFWVQGICLPPDLKIDSEILKTIFSPYNIILSDYPFSILDIVNRKVKYIFNYSQLNAWKTQFRESSIDEYKLIVSSNSQTTSNHNWIQGASLLQIATPFSNKKTNNEFDSTQISSDLNFSNFTAISPSVMNLIDQTRNLPQHIRKSWITEFMRILNRKAIFLCKLIEEYLDRIQDQSQISREKIQNLIISWINYYDDQFLGENSRQLKIGKSEIEMDLILSIAQKFSSKEIYSIVKGDGNSVVLELAVLINNYI